MWLYGYIYLVICICKFICICISIYIQMYHKCHIQTTPSSERRLPRQETFLAPSADKQTRNYDTECSNHHLPQSILRSKGLSRSKMEWWVVYTDLPVNYIYIYIYIIYNIYIHIIYNIYNMYKIYILYIYYMYITYIWNSLQFSFSFVSL